MNAMYQPESIADMAIRCETTHNAKIARIRSLATAQFYKAHLDFKVMIIRYGYYYYLSDGQALLTIGDIRNAGLSA